MDYYRLKKCPYVFSIMIAALISPFLCPFSFAQTGIAGLGVIVDSPQGEFKDINNRRGLGLSAYLGKNIFDSPLFLGFELGFVNTLSEKFNEELSIFPADPFLSVSNNNIFVMSNLLVRIQPEWKKVRPYLEGLYGGNFIFSVTSFGSSDPFSTESTSGTWEFNDFISHVGYGIGCMIRLKGAEEDTTYLELRIRSYHGGKAHYYSKGSAEIVDGTLKYSSEKTKIDFLVFYLGFSFHLN